MPAVASLLLHMALAAAPPWPNSTEGVHSFGLWSAAEKRTFGTSTPEIDRTDFMWSVEISELQSFRAAMPRAILSKYIAFSLNSMPQPISTNLTWWQENHPTWVLYRCDRKTPATYWGTGIPLDITNPEVLAWQLHANASDNPHSVDALVEAGFDSISLDVFGWGNYGKACGVFDTAGQWRTLYTVGKSWNDDPNYAKGVSNWLAAFYAGLAKRLLFIINFSSNPGDEPTCRTCLPTSLAWNASRTFWVGNHSDGDLSESGWTNFGSNVTTGIQWENRLSHVQHLQRHGKYYADVSYWGPVNVQTKALAPVTDEAIEFIIGSWMMGNEGLSSVFMGPNDCSIPCIHVGWTWKGNQNNYSQYHAAIGSPLGSAQKGVAAGSCDGVWWRNFSNAIAFVNPQPAGLPCVVQLEDREWQHLNGTPMVVPTKTVSVAAASAVVLMRGGHEQGRNSRRAQSNGFFKTDDQAHMLEPATGTVLHGAQQGEEEFRNYSRYLGSDAGPMFYTTYASLQGFNNSGAGKKYCSGLLKLLQRLGDAEHVILPHLAVTMTPGKSTLPQINAGQYDVAIDELVSGLDSMNLPVFLRPGQEFNGKWNGYESVEYVRVWRRIAAAISKRAALRRRTALIFDFTCDDHSALNFSSYLRWYPGDDVVDWWAVNCFSGPLEDPLNGTPSSMPQSPCVAHFVAAAAQRGFPVMIAESQPRYIGAQSSKSWSEWFVPLFALLRHPTVKAFSYVDRDCTHMFIYKHWGDERVETGVVGPQYRAAVRQPKFVHAANLTATRARLGLSGHVGISARTQQRKKRSNSTAAAMHPTTHDLATDTRAVQVLSGDWHVALGPVHKYGANPLLQEDRPWEAAWWNTEPSVIYENGTWHMFLNTHIECGTGDPKRPGMCPHESYAKRFPGIVPTNKHCSTQGGPSCAAGVLYCTSEDGLRWEKPSLGLINFNGTTDNNIIIAANGTDPDIGFYLDLHETNLSRRWKAFGTGFSDTSAVRKYGGCVVDVAFSESATEWPRPGSNRIVHEGLIGQNDGTADNVRWDPDLGLYIGFVRLDNGTFNRRRTGRTTSPHFLKGWSKAEQVFEGQHGYEIYTMVPWRQPSWRAGLYMAMGSFYATPTSAGHVYNELLQSEDYGRSWKQLAPHQQFIPHGPPGSYDSSIIYAAMPLLNPSNASETWIFYDGGVGPHSGPHREDTLNLAIAVSDAFAGLRYTGGSGGDDNRRALLRLTKPAPATSFIATRGLTTQLNVLVQLQQGSHLAVPTLPTSNFAASVDFVASSTMHVPQWVSLEVHTHGPESQSHSTIAMVLELTGEGIIFCVRW